MLQSNVPEHPELVPSTHLPLELPEQLFELLALPPQTDQLRLLVLEFSALVLVYALLSVGTVITLTTIPSTPPTHPRWSFCFIQLYDLMLFIPLNISLKH